MVAPDTWSAPTSGGKITGTDLSFHNVYHAGSYWFSVARDGNTDVTVRYASDPSGAWGTATLPAWPTGTTLVVPMDSNGVQYDGTHYAFGMDVGGTAGARIYYASDPTGSWSEHDFGAGTTYDPSVLYHDGSRWILAGRYLAATPSPAFIGYTAAGSAVTSAYTFGTVTGYDAADVAPTGNWNIRALAFDGTAYVTAATRSPASGLDGHLRYCTDITGATFGTPTTPQVEQANNLRYYADAGYWVSMGPNPTPYYSTTGTGTWGSATSVTTLLNSEALGVAYGNGHWAAGGAHSDPSIRPALSYLAGTDPNAATYTPVGSVALGFPYDTSTQVLDVDYAAGYWVAAVDWDGELRYCYSPILVTAPTYLRQRQSAVRAPSRVSPVQLRQSQNQTYIR